MANGTQQGLDPPPLNDVKPSTGERVLSGLGGFIKGGAGIEGKSPLDEAIEKHHQRRLDEARMHRQNAATYAGVLATGFDPKTGQPLTPEQEQQYQNFYESSWAAYEKAAGVSKDTKGHLQRAKAIVEHIIGQGRKSREGQQQPPAQAPGGDEGSQQQPTPGLNPPPKYDAQAQMAAPTLRQQLETTQGIQAGRQQFAASVEERKKVADQLGLDKDSIPYKEFVATGKFPPRARLQKAIYIDPNDPTRTPRDGSYDPDTAEYLDQAGRPVVGALPGSTAGMAPKQIHYLSPDGKPLFGFQVGMKLYDQQGQELPPGTEFFTRGMLPTETMRQVITYDAQGNPQINTLETLRTPLTGTGGAGPGGTPEAGPVGGQRRGGLTLPPTAPGKDAAGKSLGMSAGMQKAQVQRVTAVREANTQVFGDPMNPDFRPLKDFAPLADNKESRERLGRALKLTFDNLENEEKQHGSFIALIQAYTGVPQALAAAKAGVQRDVIEALTPEETAAFDATISSFSSVVGLRSLTSASAAQFSVRALERDLPMIGVTAVSSYQFNDKLAHIGEIAYNGAKTIGDTVMPPQEKEFYRKQLEALKPKSKGSTASTPPPATKGGMKAPPKANESPEDEIKRLAKELAPAPH